MKPISGIPKSKATGVPGWRHHPDEETTIIEFAQRYIPDDGGLAIELGTEYGRGASEIAFGCRNKNNIVVVSVDLFPTTHSVVGDLWNTWHQNIAEAMKYFPRVAMKQVRGDSSKLGFQVQADGKWKDINLLFIDGAHDIKGVARDLEGWTPLVAVGGVVLVHDYWKGPDSHPLHKEVKQAVDDWHNPQLWRRMDLPGSLVAFERLETQPNFVDAKNDDELKQRIAYDTQHSTVMQLGQKAFKTQKLTVQELADVKGISVSKVRLMIKGVEPVGKRGRSHLYRLEDLEE